MYDQEDMDKSSKYQWHVVCTSRGFTCWGYVLWLVTMYASALQSWFTTYHLADSCWLNDVYLWHTDTVYYHFLHAYFLHKNTLTQLLHAGGWGWDSLMHLLSEMMRRHQQTLQRLLWHASHFDGEEQLHMSAENTLLRLRVWKPIVLLSLWQCFGTAFSIEYCIV